MRTFIILCTACILCMVSCDGFQKEPDNGGIPTDLLFKNPGDLGEAVNELYRLKGRSSYWLRHYMQAQMGDDLTTNPYSSRAGIREWDMMNMGANNEYLLYYWQNKYGVIQSANYIIDGAEETPGASQAEIDYALGQAYFWRAWGYFILVRIFGPLPLVTSHTADLNLGLSTVAEVYELIVDDLKKAENLLLANYSDASRSMNGMNVVASKGAAQAVLSCVYMTMAGWPLAYGAAYYELAAAEALKVIEGANNGTYYYQLYDEFWLIHSKRENWTNSEAICAVYFSLAKGAGDDSEAARGIVHDLPMTAGGWMDTAGEIGFWVDFPEGPRKLATYPEWTNIGGNATDGWKYCRWWDEQLPQANQLPYFGKSGFTVAGSTDEYDFRQSLSPQASDWQDQIHQLVRLSEVYLFYAESVGRTGKVNQTAIDLLNRVRNRADGFGPVADRSAAGIPDRPHVEKYVNEYPPILTADQLAEAAYNEHGWEIAGWYWGAITPRVNDQQRMDRLREAYEKRLTKPEYTFDDPDNPGQTITVSEQYVQPPEWAWSQTKMFAPYPAEEVSANPKLGITGEEKLQLIK